MSSSILIQKAPLIAGLFRLDAWVTRWRFPATQG
jgi:hypothetical protein